MTNKDSLHQLLIDFFDLPENTVPEDLRQEANAAWDSLAMVQLIAELQGTFEVEFELERVLQTPEAASPRPPVLNLENSLPRRSDIPR